MSEAGDNTLENWGRRLRTEEAARRAAASAVISCSLVLLFLLCTFENNSSVGRAVATLVVVLAGTLGVWRGWWPVGERLRRACLPLGATVAAILLACTFSIDPGFSFKTFFRQHFWFASLLVVTAAWGVTAGRERAVLVALTVAGGVSALLGIVLYYFGMQLEEAGVIDDWKDFLYAAYDEQGRGYFRARGTAQSYTRAGMVFVMAFPATVALLLRALRRRALVEVALLLLVAVFSVWFVLLTKTRGPWLAVAASSAIAWFLLRGRMMPFVIVAGLAVVTAVAVPSIRQRAASMVSHLSDPNLLLSGRVDLWKQGWKPISENFLTGVGYGGNIFLTDEGLARYELVSANNRQPDLHQIYLQTFAEVGAIGFAAYTWLVLTLLWLGWRKIRESPDREEIAGSIVAFSALVSFLVFGLVFYYNEEPIAQMLWPLCGLLVAMPAKQAQEQS